MNISRRLFLRTTVTTTGTLLVYFNLGAHAQEKEETTTVKANPMPFIEIDSIGNITFISSRTDMGQGSPTSLAQILLDEMDADWDKLNDIRETQSFKASDYDNDELVTVGAISTFIGWFNHRKAGACLREGFKLAAAALWEVDASKLKTERSKVIDPDSGRTAHYHDLYESLATLNLPEEPTYKNREQSNLVGKPIKQLRVNERVTGTAKYGIDVTFPGLKTAVIARCPTFGGTVKSFDDSEALKIDGVLRIVEVPSGIAVVAEGFWSAQKGREVLSIEWDHGELENSSSESIAAELKMKLNSEMSQSKSVGDVKTTMTTEGGITLNGRFSFPFVAHATMEPMNATAWVTDEKCEIWAPTQSKIIAHQEVAKLLERNMEDIVFHRTLCGGGFGRRAQEDFVLEAVEVSKASSYPVKLIWTREDDIKHDYYRPMSEISITGKMSEDGKLSAWDSKLSFIDTSPYHFTPNARGTDRGLFVGIAGMEPAYKIPNQQTGFSPLTLPITVGILRGIAHGYTNFSIEIMIDRLAKLAARDPLELRAELLKENDRAHKVIEELQRLNSAHPPEPGMTRGYAFAFEGEPGIEYQYYSAHMADVRRLDDGSIKVDKIWIVADHGRVINPLNFKRQIHSSIYFAISMMRSGKVTMKNGQIEQSNFHDYPVSLIGEGAENVEIKLIDSDAHPMGCGEKMQAGIQPAIANAIEKLTNKEVNGIPVDGLA